VQNGASLISVPTVRVEVGMRRVRDMVRRLTVEARSPRYFKLTEGSKGVNRLQTCVRIHLGSTPVTDQLREPRDFQFNHDAQYQYDSFVPLCTLVVRLSARRISRCPPPWIQIQLSFDSTSTVKTFLAAFLG
jgi:hypothetical protein